MRDTDDDGVPDRVNFALALLMDALDVHSLDGLLGPGPRTLPAPQRFQIKAGLHRNTTLAAMSPLARFDSVLDAVHHCR